MIPPEFLRPNYHNNPNYNYGNNNRNVSLKGEAFFNVTPSKVPFVVSTDYAKITVLGTKFNVRARDDGFETGVNEGSVEINKNDKLKNLDLNPSIFFGKVSDIKIKDKLKKLTNDALKKGIFGAPTYYVNRKIFFGQDRLIYAIDEIKKQ